MKIKYLMFIALFIPLMLLYGCKTETNYDDKVKVIFELEGGTYQNCTLPVVHYYDKTDSNILITDLTGLTGAAITRSGYTLDGWYQKKVENDGVITYQDKWDFDRDTIDNTGITLYAFWKKDIKYTYQVCYYDENNEIVVLDSYSVNQGDKFKDYANYANTRYGYTAIGFKDADGNVWDEEFTHPGGETDLAIRVFVEYIEGDFAIVKNANDLRINKSKNIYLANDIDLEGEAFSFTDYKGIFMGNGYKVTNFKVNYDATRNGLIDDFNDPSVKSLTISLFGNISNATIQDVIFENVTIDIKTSLSLIQNIYVAPIAMNSKNSKLTNVTFSGKLICTTLPKDFDIESNLIVIENAPVYKLDKDTTITNNEINLILE